MFKILYYFVQSKRIVINYITVKFCLALQLTFPCNLSGASY